MVSSSHHTVTMAVRSYSCDDPFEVLGAYTYICHINNANTISNVRIYLSKFEIECLGESTNTQEHSHTQNIAPTIKRHQFTVNGKLIFVC